MNQIQKSRTTKLTLHIVALYVYFLLFFVPPLPPPFPLISFLLEGQYSKKDNYDDFVMTFDKAHSPTLSPGILDDLQIFVTIYHIQLKTTDLLSRETTK